ncbi:MAG TPA: hypothetical protein VHC22_29850 [Pirellulales bacterium]|nr:hypothetical protein [Pirellulales bacterium]
MNRWLKNRFTRAVRRRLFGSATLDVLSEIAHRGVAPGDLDALEVFGGTGELHTADYARLVRSLTVWEIDPTAENTLRRNLPGAKIKITDSLHETKVTPEKYHLVVVDNPLFVSESSLCEHFEFFPAIFRLLADRAVLVLNVIPEASPRFRAEFPYLFNPYHLLRRGEFYGSADPQKIPIADMLPTYASFAVQSGFDLTWHFSKKRGKNIDVHFLVLGLQRAATAGRETNGR